MSGQIARIYSWLSRCSTARGSGSRLSCGGPTKVKAHKTFLFTEDLLKVENKGHTGLAHPIALDCKAYMAANDTCYLLLK